jgi:PhnB protein
MKLNVYLSFDGRCREAFEFYEKTFGGRIVFIQKIGESPMAATMPAETHDRVMHVTLHIGDQVLQGADAPPGQFSKPAGFCVAAHFNDIGEAERVFSTLAQNGTVQMPFQPTFWAKGFGMVIDQFGTPWIVNAGQE